MKPIAKRYYNQPPSNWYYHLQSEQDLDLIRLLTRSIESNSLPMNKRILKQDKTKQIYSTDILQKKIVVKHQKHAHLYEKLKATFRYWIGGYKYTTYTYQEFINTCKVNTLKISSPIVYGYGIKHKMGFILSETLISEAIPNVNTLEFLLSQNGTSSGQMKNFLLRAFKLLEMFIENNFVNLDLHSENILLSYSDPILDVAIDHEYADYFDNQHRKQVTSFLFGYLFRCHVKRYMHIENYKEIAYPVMKKILKIPFIDSQTENWFLHAATTRIPKKKRKKYLRTLK